jgi:hypothetical protein
VTKDFLKRTLVQLQRFVSVTCVQFTPFYFKTPIYRSVCLCFFFLRQEYSLIQLQRWYNLCLCDLVRAFRPLIQLQSLYVRHLLSLYLSLSLSLSRSLARSLSLSRSLIQLQRFYVRPCTCDLVKVNVCVRARACPALNRRPIRLSSASLPSAFSSTMRTPYSPPYSPPSFDLWPPPKLSLSLSLSPLLLLSRRTWRTDKIFHMFWKDLISDISQTSSK